jgi:hypothetical protein
VVHRYAAGGQAAGSGFAEPDATAWSGA